jgi:hypothetical protein
VQNPPGRRGLRRVLPLAYRPGRQALRFLMSRPYVCILRDTSGKRLGPSLVDLGWGVALSRSCTATPFSQCAPKNRSR